MFPPWEWRALYPYPRTHPAWHKSQVEFDEPNLESMPNYATTRAYLVSNAYCIEYLDNSLRKNISDVLLRIELGKI